MMSAAIVLTPVMVWSVERVTKSEVLITAEGVEAEVEAVVLITSSVILTTCILTTF